jgi:hypothetical protein
MFRIGDRSIAAALVDKRIHQKLPSSSGRAFVSAGVILV